MEAVEPDWWLRLECGQVIDEEPAIIEIHSGEDKSDLSVVALASRYFDELRRRIP